VEHDPIARAGRRLDALCLTHPDRHVGGPGVAAANDLFASAVSAAGWSVERIAFDCVDWTHIEARLSVQGANWPLHVGPYSPPYSGKAPLVGIATVEALEALDSPGAILLLHGAIAAEQVTPRNYPFYQMDAHVRLLAALDRAAPAAVIAATDRTIVAAALHPFPLFEDADLGFPSAYLLDTQATALLAHASERVHLEIDSAQIPARSEQLVARLTGRSPRRIALSAHIDSRHGTPGALDNATGVCVLLAVADLLGGQTPELTVELLPFNGEDNFAAYGEMAYLARHGETLSDIALAINIDAAGRRGDESAISFYGCTDELRERVRALVAAAPHIVDGPEWPMSDHMVFAMRGVPAMAVTSTGLLDIVAEVAHTAADVPSLADPGLIVATAHFIADVAAAM